MFFVAVCRHFVFCCCWSIQNFWRMEKRKADTRWYDKRVCHLREGAASVCQSEDIEKAKALSVTARLLARMSHPTTIMFRVFSHFSGFQNCVIQKSQFAVMRRSNWKAWITCNLYPDWVDDEFRSWERRYLQDNNLPLEALLVMDNAQLILP